MQDSRILTCESQLSELFPDFGFSSRAWAQIPLWPTQVFIPPLSPQRPSQQAVPRAVVRGTMALLKMCQACPVSHAHETLTASRPIIGCHVATTHRSIKVSSQWTSSSVRHSMASTFHRVPRRSFRKQYSPTCSSSSREYKITLLPGDGIGPEILAVAVEVLKLVGEQEGHTQAPKLLYIYDYYKKKKKRSEEGDRGAVGQSARNRRKIGRFSLQMKRCLHLLWFVT